MLFQKLIVVPANTAKADPYHTTMNVAIGMLDRMWIKFLAGCLNQVFLQVMQGQDMLAPSEHNQSLVGDDQEFQSSHNTEIKTGYTTLDIYAWSPDTRYDHSITVTVNVFTSVEYSRLEKLVDQLNKNILALSKFLGAPSV